MNLKEFSESNLGIIILSIIPSSALYISWLNIDMELIKLHFIEHLPFYVSILLAITIGIILTIRKMRIEQKQLIGSMFYLIVEYIETLDNNNRVRDNHNLEHDKEISKQYIKNFEIIADKLEIPMLKMKAPKTLKQNIGELENEHNKRLEEITSNIKDLLKTFF